MRRPSVVDGGFYVFLLSFWVHLSEAVLCIVALLYTINIIVLPLA